MEKISIVIPTYNRSKTIVKSINSVLNQTYANLEIVVIDDGSTDGTESIIKKMQNKDRRIKYVKMPKNRGACFARNLGIKKSTGKYIAFQDSDDIYVKHKLANQLANLLNNASDLDFCKVQLHTEHGKYVMPTKSQELALENSSVTDMLCDGNLISTQAILAKKEIFEKVSFNPKMPRLQDYDLALRVAQHCNISYTDKILVNLYRQADSISSSKEKLYEACAMMVETDYNLNTIQKKRFIKTLFNIIESTAQEENSRLFHDLSISFQSLEKRYVTLQNQNNDLQNEIQRILNSKSWKTLEKFRKIIHPLSK